MNAIEKHLYNKGRNDGLEEAAKLCDAHGAIHRTEGDETTWAALAESYAEMIRALKSTPAPGGASK